MFLLILASEEIISTIRSFRRHSQPAILALQAAFLGNPASCAFSKQFCIQTIDGSRHTTIRNMSTTRDDDIRQKKQALRKEIRAGVKLLTKEDIQEQSLKVWERLFALPQYQSAKSVGLFLSMPKGEIETDPVLHHAIKSGKSVYVPQVGQNFEKCDMELLKVVIENPSLDEIFHKDWPRNKWGIPEPPPDMPIENAKPGDIDLLIVPGLGFDRKGNRLGQGKGYYDRFIARMTVDNTPLPLIAVALTPLLIDGDIPVNEYDRQMDMILMPDETITPDQKSN